MKVFQFPTAGMARRFTRNARGRGYTVKVDARLVSVDPADAQLRLLVQRYAGLKVKHEAPAN